MIKNLHSKVNNSYKSYLLLQQGFNRVYKLNQFYQNNSLSQSNKRYTILKAFNFSTAKTAKTQTKENQFNENSNYFQILGVSTSATDQQIKTAYLNMIKKHHPDLSKEQNASQKFQLIQKAYEILSDPQQRSVYRQNIKVSNPQQYQDAAEIKQKFIKFSRKQNVPDQWQFSYKLFKRHYEQVSQKQKQYQKFVGQGQHYYVHKKQLNVSTRTRIQQISMIIGSVAIGASTLYYMWA